MTIPEIIDKMKELGGKPSLSFTDKGQIEQLYKEVIDKTFVRTSCGDCYRDAAIEIYTYLRRYGKMKEKSNYALKNGVVLQMGFSSSEMYTNANLTDEAAERYLAKNSTGVKYFSRFPEDWEARAKKTTEEKAVKPRRRTKKTAKTSE